MLWMLRNYDMETLDDIPKSFPAAGRPAEQKAWLNRVATEAVKYCEQSFGKEQVEVAAKIINNPERLKDPRPERGQEDPLGFCLCGKGQPKINI